MIVSYLHSANLQLRAGARFVMSTITKQDLNYLMIHTIKMDGSSKKNQKHQNIPKS